MKWKEKKKIKAKFKIKEDFNNYNNSNKPTLIFYTTLSSKQLTFACT